MDHSAVAIIGAGASGLCAAIQCARRFEKAGLSAQDIVLLEALPRVGKKLLATGNGRCNLTNRRVEPGCYFENGAFAAQVLARADTERVLDFFQSLGILTREDAEGRVYPQSNQAASVLDALRFAVQKYGVRVLTETPVQTLARTKNGFLINGLLTARRVIVCTGGQSSKQLGSDGSGFALLRSLGVRVTPTYPALTGLLLGDYPRALKGVRAQCRVELCAGEQVLAQDTGEVQFNENGVSGIPVMQVSRFASLYKNTVLRIDRLPALPQEELEAYIDTRRREYGFLTAEDLLSTLLPKRLAGVCVKDAGLSAALPAAEVGRGDASRLAACVKHQAYRVLRPAGFEQSQVTAGGADTAGFSAHTLESKHVPGLYCCGEILNVDGLCGGYNLQWAWGSALVAADAVADSLQG